VDLDSWNVYGSPHALIELAQLYVQTRQPVSALDALLQVDPDVPDFPDDLMADQQFLTVVALRDYGYSGDADEALLAARDRFPNDPRFFLIELTDEPIPSLRYREELERLIRNTSDHADALLATVLRYAETAPTAAENAWAVDTYSAMGGDDPAIAIAAGRFSDATPVDLFLNLGGAARRDLLDRVTESAGDELDMLTTALTAFTGIATVDDDSDGYWEERLTVDNGMVHRWEVDRNQDGVSELVVEFGAESPERVETMTELGPATVVYDLYPYVESVERRYMDGRLRTIVRPRSLRYAILDGLPDDGPRYDSAMSVRLPPPALDIDAIDRTAIAVEELGPDGVVTERRYLQSGMVSRSVADTDGDGSWDRLTVMDEGEPSAALWDIDGDGYFEVAEGYVDGRLAMRAIDENDSGTPEIIEQYEEDTREWDLNEDGTIDVREFDLWTRSVVGEFDFLGLNR
jgi:hypothetical protein